MSVSSNLERLTTAAAWAINRLRSWSSSKILKKTGQVLYCKHDLWTRLLIRVLKVVLILGHLYWQYISKDQFMTNGLLWDCWTFSKAILNDLLDLESWYVNKRSFPMTHVKKCSAKMELWSEKLTHMSLQSKPQASVVGNELVSFRNNIIASIHRWNENSRLDSTMSFYLLRHSTRARHTCMWTQGGST